MCTRLPSALVGLNNRTCCTASELLIPLLCFSRWDKSLAPAMQFFSLPGEAVRSTGPEQQRYHKAPSFVFLSQS
jgi:hypothetical protein